MKIIGLDVGTKRIGVAKADTTIKIAVPEKTIPVDGAEFQEISRLARINNTDLFVLGLPRNNQGQETAQSQYVKDFAASLKTHLPTAKIRYQDESLTSVEAETRLKAKKSYRKKGKLFQKGEVDAEAAAIILQDFIDSPRSPDTQSANRQPVAAEPPSEGVSKQISDSASVSRTASWPAVNEPPVKTGGREGSQSGTFVAGDRSEAAQHDDKKGSHKMKKGKKALSIVVTIVVILGVAGFLSYAWYSGTLAAPYPPGCPESAEAPECTPIEFTVDPGDTPAAIAKELEKTGLIRSQLAFQIHAHLSGEAKEYQAGTYTLQKSLTTPEISQKIARGEIDSNVFSFTIIPGQNIFEIQSALAELGYAPAEITAAFAQDYPVPILNSRPAGASLEGYLYPDTYEFYKDATVPEILERAIKEMATVISEHNLEQKFAEQGLTLHEGLTLASIVEEESTPGEYANVAGVFLNRLAVGMTLGSDVTAKYAVDLVDPDRQLYTDNSLILDIDSPYNTRKYFGLPPAPITNPGLSALEGVANPADNSYLFFLTGDDGMMYYSSTESGHLQNVAEHCQELCNISL